MLSSSLRMQPVTISMLLVQSQHMYCTPAKQKIKILRTRVAQKELYGEIRRDETRDKSLDTSRNGLFDEIKVSSSSQASEFHWLVKKGKSTKIDIKLHPLQQSFDAEIRNRKIKNESNPSSTTTKKAADTVIKSAKKILKPFIVQKTTVTSQEIPFDMNELNAMIKYPLITAKCSLSQTIAFTDKSMQVPSISKVLSATMPEGARIALKKWKMSKITELGFDGFKAQEKETLNLGRDFHSAIEQYLTNGQTPDSDSSITHLWQSISPSLNELQPKPVLMEQPVLHADLKYKGIIDNVSLVRDQLCAFEWKTSEKAKPKLTSTYDAPVQLLAYLGALNADPRYDLVVKNARVVVAYKNGDAGNVFELSETDLRKYWLIWLQRLQEYWIRVKDGTVPDPI